MTYLIAFLVLLLSAICTTSLALVPADYHKWFSGDGTYYGYTGAGNCALRGKPMAMYRGMVPVAMNNQQYGSSASCGACLIVYGNGKGSGGNPIKGQFKAYVHDRCPECKYGDIDLSKSGDGRWHVGWKFVACPGQKMYFLVEGSNRWYMKLQPRGMQAPAKSMQVNGVNGKSTQDNFFIFNNGGGFRFPVKIRVVTVLGQVLNAQQNYYIPDGEMYPAGH